MNSCSLSNLCNHVADLTEVMPLMRRLIIDLAVRGKLVKQNSSNEPAIVLLERIKAEKERLLSLGIPKNKMANTSKLTDIPFNLPKTWAWTPLGTAFIYDAGVKRKPKELYPSFWLLELEDIEKDTGRLLKRVSSAERESKSTKSEFQAGDILYGKLRPYLNKVLVADMPGYSTTEIVAIRPYLNLCPEYCALALRRSDFLEYVSKLGQGTKMPRLRTQDAINAPFPLPPLAEQFLIASKVNELMVLCGQLEEAFIKRDGIRNRLTKTSLGRLIRLNADEVTLNTYARFIVNSLSYLTQHANQIKQLRQITLSLAIQGKLTEQDSADDSAPNLLNRIQREKERLLAAGIVKKRQYRAIRRSREHEDPPFKIPSTWCWCRLDTIGTIIGGGTPSTADSDNFAKPGKGIPWLTPADLGGYTNRYIQRGARDLTDKGLQSSSATLVPAETILFSSRAPIGYVAIAANPITTNQGFKSIVPYIADCSQYIAIVMQVLKPEIESRSSGTTFKEASGKILANVQIPLPPLAEQRRIIITVDKIMAICDQLEANLITVKTNHQRLLESIVHKFL